MSGIPSKLQAANTRLVEDRRYVTAAVTNLIFIERPGLGSLGVDKYGRVYYDPAAVERRWDVLGLAQVLYHEIWHLLNKHPERLSAWPADIANAGADAEINSRQGKEYGLPVDKWGLRPITPQGLGLQDGLLAEQYCELLCKQREEQGQEQGQAGRPARGGGVGDAASASVCDSSDENACDANAESASASSADSDDSSCSESASSASSGSTRSQSDSNGPDKTAAAGRQADSSEPIAGRPDGSSSSGDRPAPAPAPAPAPTPAAGRCGSCATGRQEQWELPPPDQGGPRGLSQIELEIIRRQVAEAIRNCGNAPAHERRWAEEVLAPIPVDWRRELATAVRHACARVAGLVDYTYQRPSRRQAAYCDIIAPGFYRPCPNVAVIIDTSGSMTDQDLGEAIAQIRRIAQIAPSQVITFITCDAQVHDIKRIAGKADVKLAGGGGTDLRRAFDALPELKPRPHVVVVISDFETPWPELPPAGVRVIGLCTGGDPNRAPDWVKPVKIEK